MVGAARNKRATRFNPRELAFQPWFLPKASRLAINSLISPDYRNKMRAYFDDYGCMRCGKHDVYDCNGMCLPCNQLIRRRLKTCVRRRLGGRLGVRIDLIMGRRKELASKLLKPFCRASRKVSISYRLNPASLRNPVDEALGFLTPGSWTDRYQGFKNDPAEEMGSLGKSVHDLPTGRRR